VFAGPIAGNLGAEDTVATLLSVFDGEATSMGDRVDARSDLDADGVADLAARVEGPGFYNVVAIFPAPILGTLYAQDVANLGHPDDGFPQSSGVLEAASDWDQDGYSDLVIDYDGYVYLFSLAPSTPTGARRMRTRRSNRSTPRISRGSRSRAGTSTATGGPTSARPTARPE
jgi:hypothetical protein